MLHRYPLVQRWEETDDVFVEAIAKLHCALADVRPESPRHFYNLAATQIRRVLVDLARRYGGPQGLGSHHDTVAKDPDGRTPPHYERADVSCEPSSLAQWSEFHEQVEAMPAEEREVFSLLWYEQMSQEEAAEMLGIASRTVRRRWQNACYWIQKLRLGEPLPGE
jgi:RNA polymerase sigma-70 factor (ECF subfamily)